MASGFPRFSKAHSTKSLGSFVDVSSAGSEFEAVDLEDLSLAPSLEMPPNEHGIVGKNKTPAPASTSSEPADISDRDTFENDDIDPSAAVRQIVDPLHDGLQNLEQSAQKAAEAAKDFTSKLWTSGATEAKSSVLRLAGDVSSWWAALDPGASAAADKPQDTSRSAQGSEEVQELFGLSTDEELMERFACTLMQTLECNHNAFSKPQQIRSPGKLYITDKHTCFDADGIQFAIPHADVQKVTKAAGGKVASLRLDLAKSGDYVSWDSFKGSDLESALGLLEHLTA